MPKTIVGVLRGGTSSRYSSSLAMGTTILTMLPEEKYETRDIFIDKSGHWHVRGIPMQSVRALSQIDVALNTLEDSGGNDKTVTRLLEQSNTPFVGSSAQSSSLASQKNQMRTMLQQEGILMPCGISFNQSENILGSEMATRVHRMMAPPYIIKPNTGSRSEGIQFASSFAGLAEMIESALTMYGSIIVEEYIKGEEAVATVVEGFRYQQHYVFPISHIQRPEGARYITPNHHDQNLLQHRTPSQFTMGHKKALEETARQVHGALGLRHISHVDFMVTPRGNYVLGARTMLDWHEATPLHSMLQSVGSNRLELLEHLIQIARQ